MPAAGNANMVLCVGQCILCMYRGASVAVHGTMHASCTWNYGRGAGEVMRACTLAKLYFHLSHMEGMHIHFEKMEEATFLHIMVIESVLGRG